MDKRTLCELLECSVCLESFNECNNKVLPCQHTFCRFCLDAIVSVENRLICPECRFSVDTKVDDLPSNVLLNRILSTLKNPQAQDVKKQKEKRRKKGLSSLVDYGMKELSMPCAKALYSYKALENGDLSFKKDDIVELLYQVDENWFVGRLNGKQGFIPSNYIQVLCPLPSNTSTRRIDYHHNNRPMEKGDWSTDCLTFDKNDLITVIPKSDERWLEESFQQKVIPMFHDELDTTNRLLLLQSKLASNIVDEQSQFENIIKPARSDQSTNEHSIMASSCDFIGSNDSRTSSQSTSHSYPNLSNASKSSAIGSSETEATDTANEKSEEQNDTLLVRPIFDGDGVLPLYQALFDYFPKSTDELDLETGKMYVALKDKGGGWLLGKSVAKGTVGLFPDNHVKFIKNWNYLMKDEKEILPHEFKISEKSLGNVEEPNDHHHFPNDHHHHLPPSSANHHLQTPAKQSNSCDDLSTFDLLNLQVTKPTPNLEGKKKKRRSANVESMLSCVKSQHPHERSNHHHHHHHAPERSNHHYHHHQGLEKSNRIEHSETILHPDDHRKHSSQNHIGYHSTSQSFDHQERSPDAIGDANHVPLRGHLRLSSIAYGVSSLIHRNMVKQKMMNKRCMSASASRCK